MTFAESFYDIDFVSKIKNWQCKKFIFYSAQNVLWEKVLRQGIQRHMEWNKAHLHLVILFSEWNLDTWRRTDIDQASMAAFLAGIVGIPFPKNAVVSRNCAKTLKGFWNLSSNKGVLTHYCHAEQMY